MLIHNNWFLQPILAPCLKEMPQPAIAGRSGTYRVLLRSPRMRTIAHIRPESTVPGARDEANLLHRLNVGNLPAP